MSDPNKRKPRRAPPPEIVEGQPTPEPAPGPTPPEPVTVTSLCEKAARIVDGLAAEQGLRALVVVYDPKLRTYHADWRGSPPDIAALMLMRASIRIMNGLG